MYPPDLRARNIAFAWTGDPLVSDEVIIFLNSSSGRIRTLARIERACGQNNYRLCPGDCGYCPWQIQGRIFPLERDCLHCPLQFDCDAANTEDIVAARDSLDRIYSTASSLNACCGTILQMHYEYGYRVSEIAKELEMDINTVKYWLKRSLHHLRSNPHYFCDVSEMTTKQHKGEPTNGKQRKLQNRQGQK